MKKFLKVLAVIIAVFVIGIGVVGWQIKNKLSSVVKEAKEEINNATDGALDTVANLTDESDSKEDSSNTATANKSEKQVTFTLNTNTEGKSFEYTLTLPAGASYKIYPQTSTDKVVANSAVDIKLNNNTTLTINQGFSGADEYDHRTWIIDVFVSHKQFGILNIVKNAPTEYNKYTTYTYSNNIKDEGVCTNTADGKEIDAPCGTTIVKNEDMGYYAYYTCKLQEDSYMDMNLCNSVVESIRIAKK